MCVGARSMDSPALPSRSAGVWSESIGQALETAVSVKAGVVWVNTHNMFDAAAGFGGYKESGFGREGGQEGLYVGRFRFSSPHHATPTHRAGR